jgi:hypothetical protein
MSSLHDKIRTLAAGSLVALTLAGSPCNAQDVAALTEGKEVWQLGGQPMESLLRNNMAVDAMAERNPGTLPLYFPDCNMLAFIKEDRVSEASKIDEKSAAEFESWMNHWWKQESDTYSCDGSTCRMEVLPRNTTCTMTYNIGTVGTFVHVDKNYGVIYVGQEGTMNKDEIAQYVKQKLLEDFAVAKRIREEDKRKAEEEKKMVKQRQEEQAAQAKRDQEQRKKDEQAQKRAEKIRLQETKKIMLGNDKQEPEDESFASDKKQREVYLGISPQARLLTRTFSESPLARDTQEKIVDIYPGSTPKSTNGDFKSFPVIAIIEYRHLQAFGTILPAKHQGGSGKAYYFLEGYRSWHEKYTRTEWMIGLDSIIPLRHKKGTGDLYFIVGTGFDFSKSELKAEDWSDLSFYSYSFNEEPIKRKEKSSPHIRLGIEFASKKEGKGAYYSGGILCDWSRREISDLAKENYLVDDSMPEHENTMKWGDLCVVMYLKILKKIH